MRIINLNDKQHFVRSVSGQKERPDCIRLGKKTTSGGAYLEGENSDEMSQD